MAVFLFIFLLAMVAYTILFERYTKWWRLTPVETPGDNTLISLCIILPVRNEEKNIRTILKCLLEQNYPRDRYEIIVVDDHSTDNTRELIEEFFPREMVTLISLPVSSSGKKAAIALGIQHSSSHLIITTDADCTMGANWLRTYASFYAASNAKFIAGPVSMTSRSNLSGIFQRLDFLMMQGITCAAVQSRMHNMCNGANLAYERKVFHEVNGFEGIDEIPSGDDMLLMYKVSRKHPGSVQYLKNKEAIVTTSAEPGWRKFFSQRIRWASKAAYYRDRKIMIAMAITYIVNLFFLGLVVMCVMYPAYWWMMLLFFVMKILVELPLMAAVARFFEQRRLLLFFPFLQPLHMCYIVIAGWLGQFGSFRWKDRVIKNKNSAKLVKQ